MAALVAREPGGSKPLTLAVALVVTSWLKGALLLVPLVDQILLSVAGAAPAL